MPLPLGNAAALHPDWFTPDSIVGLTAGASAPETLVRGVIEGLRQSRLIRPYRHRSVVHQTANLNRPFRES
jgi:4-hydroxy-3-methylbut-2-enyl diphosphate reductase IspH